MIDENNSASLQAAQEHWGREANDATRYGKGFHWVESPIVMSYLNEQITGNPKIDWLAYTYQKYLERKNPPVTRILSLGCGGGALERRLCQMGFNDQIEACDFSVEALEYARAMAAQENLHNISYFTSDLNYAKLPRDTYDVIFAGSALHHISNLEHLLDQLHETLTDDGLLIINEYVGPFKLQWTPQQTKIIDELLHLLPQKYLKRVSAVGQFKDSFLGPAPISEIDAIDPTESVRSDEIVPLIRARFFIREQKNFGGTLLQMLLQDILGNFDPADSVDTGFLQLLIYIEKLLIREYVLESDFTFLVAGRSQNVVNGTPKDGSIDSASELTAPDTRMQSMDKMLRQCKEHARGLEARLCELDGRLIGNDSFESDKLEVIRTISPEDGMFAGSGDHYFNVGLSALRCVRIGLTAGGRLTCRTILDLPCGYGRVLRTLKAAFPDAEFTACDVQRKAVDFCAATFGATPVYGDEDPAHTIIQGSFDLIWCGSLLTHLNKDQWHGFLGFFEGLLSPEGVLVFTVHGRRSIRHLRDGTQRYGLDGRRVQKLLDGYNRCGFGYSNYPDMKNYGISISSPPWVLSQLEKHPNLRIVTYIEEGWDNHQDAVACLKVR